MHVCVCVCTQAVEERDHQVAQLQRTCEEVKKEKKRRSITASDMDNEVSRLTQVRGRMEGGRDRRDGMKRLFFHSYSSSPSSSLFPLLLRHCELSYNSSSSSFTSSLTSSSSSTTPCSFSSSVPPPPHLPHLLPPNSSSSSFSFLLIVVFLLLVLFLHRLLIFLLSLAFIFPLFPPNNM